MTSATLQYLSGWTRDPALRIRGFFFARLIGTARLITVLCAYRTGQTTMPTTPAATFWATFLAICCATTEAFATCGTKGGPGYRSPLCMTGLVRIEKT